MTSRQCPIILWVLPFGGEICLDTISLYYFLEASKDLNFSQTARRLYISQQNLSNHIARLEGYYGVQFFERKPRLALTYFGEVLLEYAKGQRMEEENLKNRIETGKRQEVGCLQIGCSPNRTSMLASALIAQFLERYPSVQIHLHHYHSSILAEKVLSGELDFSLSVPQKHQANLVTTIFLKDYILLMVKDSLLRRYYGADSDDMIRRFRKGAAIRDFVRLPLLTFRESKLVETCFQTEGLTPNLAVSSNYPQFFMMDYYEDFLATIISKGNYVLMRENLKSDVHVFPILVNGEFIYHDIAFIRHKRKYLPPYGQYFFELAKKYFQNMDTAALPI